ncbi:histone H2a [Blastocystis sp. subtype 4]|uniref:histone H2a n=1 Tax=Blastocystis sp. subtype 4 TaxID=944170 RepID=UPI000711E84B|nr:histone H2a [Blastocystis sp. subtype 4]KNB42641.1 histone H2a [Blastocystis sp. subtype 4]|eukprot:XP_014526084.1 histone H2a [Blastocystis sp. subtype 4]
MAGKGKGGRGKSEGKTQSRSSRAGITFPVGRIARYMRDMRVADRIGAGAPVYLAAVLEYLTAEILELAGNVAQEGKKNRVIPRHIQLAVRNDEELNALLGNVTIASGGVMPFKVKKKRKKKKRKRKKMLNHLKHIKLYHIVDCLLKDLFLLVLDDMEDFDISKK